MVALFGAILRDPASTRKVSPGAARCEWAMIAGGPVLQIAVGEWAMIAGGPVLQIAVGPPGTQQCPAPNSVTPFILICPLD